MGVSADMLEKQGREVDYEGVSIISKQQNTTGRRFFPACMINSGINVLCLETENVWTEVSRYTTVQQI